MYSMLTSRIATSSKPLWRRCPARYALEWYGSVGSSSGGCINVIRKAIASPVRSRKFSLAYCALIPEVQQPAERWVRPRLFGEESVLLRLLEHTRRNGGNGGRTEK